MKKIMVIGCPGSGKSTFSKKLHQMTGIPLFHLDMLYWNSDRTTVDKAVFVNDWQIQFKRMNGSLMEIIAPQWSYDYKRVIQLFSWIILWRFV